MSEWIDFTLLPSAVTAVSPNKEKMFEANRASLKELNGGKEGSKGYIFEDLYELDEDDEETENNSTLSSFQQALNPSLSHPSSTILSGTVAEDISTPIVKPLTDDLATMDSTIMPPAESIKEPSTENTRKRKWEQFLEILPENEQIFRGLAFYFFPNDDVLPLRRRRIKRARERGATWVQDWAIGVTHIILDKDQTYNDVLKDLKISNIPKNVVLVTQDYTAHCIQHQLLLNPYQAQYYPEGYQGAEEIDAVSPTKSSMINRPLQESTKESSLEPQRPSFSNKFEEPTQTTEYTRNALDEAIEEAKEVDNLPLDSDQDDGLVERIELGDTDDERSESESKKARPKKYSNADWQQKFSCMQKNDGLNRLENPNHRTIETLQAMLDYYNRTRDQWRSVAYRKAITSLRNQPHKVTTKDKAIRIPNIGKRLAAKIEEIVWTDKLRRLENIGLESNDRILQMFMNIYGVGFAQATTWINQGYRTMENLVKSAHLTKNQLIGIDHYENFLARIPREEVELHGDIVQKAIHDVDEGIQMTIGGSYRRGAADSSDVDFIITKPDCSIDSLRYMVVEVIIPQLQEDGYLKVGLAVTSQQSGTKWHGAVVLPGASIWRRVGFLLVPSEEMGAALIYFTGNNIFNRSIRLLDNKKGMRLNQRGLWK